MSSIPSHAQVVVIGAGAVGASVAYHLTKLGWTDIVVLERNAIGSGTTWHSAAGFTATSVNPADLRKFRYAQSEIQRIEEEAGLSVGRKVIGRMVFSYHEESMAGFRRISAHGRSADFRLETLTPDETLNLLPILSPDGLLGGLWNPDAYRVDPAGFTEALLRLARRHGAKVFENTRVTSITADNSQIRAVSTEEGDINCEIVINCAGVWAREIAAMVDLSLPIVANEHFYVITKPIEGLPKNLPGFRADGELFYGREEVGGLLLGVFDEHAKTMNLSDLPTDFSFGLLPERWEQLTPYVDTIVQRLPLFASAEVKTFINGPEAFTPDHRYILGEANQTKGFYTLAGMNSGGIAGSLMAGRQIAELITQGAPTEDLTDVDICRFQGFEGSEEWLRLTGPDLTSSGYFFSKSAQISETRDVRLSPVHSLLRAQSANFKPVCGWEVATSFGNPDNDQTSREVSLLCSAAGLVDQSYFGKLRVRGYGTTDELKKMASEWSPENGSTAKRLMLMNSRGGVESMPIALRLGSDDWLLLVEPDEAPALHRLLSRVATASTISDETSGWAQFLIAGSAAEKAMCALKGSDKLTEIHKGYIGVVPVTIVPVDSEFIILCATEYAIALYQYVLQHGKSGLAQFTPVGSSAVEQLRVAQGIVRWGRDVNAYCPAVLDPTESDKVTRIIVLRTVEAAPAEPQIHAPVWSNNVCIGNVTSIAPSGSKMIAIARIFGKLDKDVWIDTGAGMVRVEVTSRGSTR